MENKTTTSITIKPDLLKTARELNINMSQTLEEALTIKIGIPNKKKDIEDKILEHKTKITFLEAKLTELEKTLEEETQENLIDKYKEKIKELKQYKKKYMVEEGKPEVYNKMLKAVAIWFNKEVEEVLHDVDAPSYDLAEVKEN